jgi:hypothetical protein
MILPEQSRAAPNQAADCLAPWDLGLQHRLDLEPALEGRPG